MATDYWSSSHFKRWSVDHAVIKQARAEDLNYVDDPDHLAFLGILFANIISKLGNKLRFRQRVIATATVFFRRFYLKNSYCETDPCLVLAACCYVAAKAEESPVNIKILIQETREILNEYNIRNFPPDTSKLAEMEFYLVDDLECDLVVYHPYRTLMILARSPDWTASDSDLEAGELGTGIEDGEKYWGSNCKRLDMQAGGAQFAWFIVNDTYRSDICLLYPPHLIAIAALYLTCILQPHARQAHIEWVTLKQAASTIPPTTSARRSQRHANSSSSTSSKNSTSMPASTASSGSKKFDIPPQDFVGFFASLNVNMRLIATIAQEIISFYALWDRFKDDSISIASRATSMAARVSGNSMAGSAWSSIDKHSRSGSLASATTPGEGNDDGLRGNEVDNALLVQLVNKMRTMRELDIAHPASGRPVAVNRILERTQAAGQFQLGFSELNEYLSEACLVMETLSDKKISLSEVQKAAEKIRPYVHRTPIVTSITLDKLASSTGVNIHLLMKCENLQKVGAFKIRGATNAILSLIEARKGTTGSAPLSVITHSSGNHAQALAYASRELGVSCQVVMPSNSASVKKDAVRGYGAKVTECIPTLQAREDTVQEIVDKINNEGGEIVLVPPYDDEKIIAGQGTLALEAIEQAEELGHPLDILVTPVGGGGMLSGCALAAKGTDPGIWIIGAEPAEADDAYKSFKMKTFVPQTDPKTIADGLRTSLGQITFPLILDNVDAIHTVTEEQIIQAMKLVYERVKLVIEPSSAVALAVVLYSQEFKDSLHYLIKRRKKQVIGELNVGVVFSGGNVDFKELSSLFGRI